MVLTGVPRDCATRPIAAAVGRVRWLADQHDVIGRRVRIQHPQGRGGAAAADRLRQVAAADAEHMGHRDTGVVQQAGELLGARPGRRNDPDPRRGSVVLQRHWRIPGQPR